MNDWKQPKIGDLVLFFSEKHKSKPKKLGKLIEIHRSPYGYWNFFVLVDGKIRETTSLHCRPVEY
tara:strand:+ start:131 stop:325 length:195 start_codon:yes stop_codon:yes gene_type:complete